MVDSLLLNEIRKDCLETYHRTEEDLGGAINVISAPRQSEVEEYCKLLYHISKNDYQVGTYDNLTSKGAEDIYGDLGRLVEKADAVVIGLQQERSALVPLRSFQPLRKIFDP